MSDEIANTNAQNTKTVIARNEVTKQSRWGLCVGIAASFCGRTRNEKKRDSLVKTFKVLDLGDLNFDIVCYL